MILKFHQLTIFIHYYGLDIIKNGTELNSHPNSGLQAQFPSTEFRKAFTSPSRSPGVPWNQEQVPGSPWNLDVAPGSPWNLDVAPGSPWNLDVAPRSPWNLEKNFAFTSPSRNQGSL